MTIELLVPKDDCESPDLSIVVPSLNEALTIGEFVDWCKEGLARAGVKGEILIVDSSTDETAQIAVARGARVLRVPKRGLGRAYIDAIPFIRGKYCILGDADLTYDFRELIPFVQAFRQGYEFVMGSRFRGFIEPGAMPPLHRYFGTPLTTWILNRLFSRAFSDIHCGMRGITRDGLERLRLTSQSWEYASEMIIKSVHLGLRTTEVPIRFYKDREGRLSHHKRSGWLSPWIAGWSNLRAMLIYGANFFLYKPGFVLLALGGLLTILLVSGPRQVGHLELSLNWMLLGTSLAILGLQCVYMGILAQALYDLEGRLIAPWTRRFAYNRSIVASALGFSVGAALCMPLVFQYIRLGFLLPNLTRANYLAVAGLLGMVLAFMTFTFTLVLHALAAIKQKGMCGSDILEMIRNNDRMESAKPEPN